MWLNSIGSEIEAIAANEYISWFWTLYALNLSKLLTHPRQDDTLTNQNSKLISRIEFIGTVRAIYSGCSHFPLNICCICSIDVAQFTAIFMPSFHFNRSHNDSLLEISNNFMKIIYNLAWQIVSLSISRQVKLDSVEASHINIISIHFNSKKTDHNMSSFVLLIEERKSIRT